MTREKFPDIKKHEQKHAECRYQKTTGKNTQILKKHGQKHPCVLEKSAHGMHAQPELNINVFDLKSSTLWVYLVVIQNS